MWKSMFLICSFLRLPFWTSATLLIYAHNICTLPRAPRSATVAWFLVALTGRRSVLSEPLPPPHFFFFFWSLCSHKSALLCHCITFAAKKEASFSLDRASFFILSKVMTWLVASEILFFAEYYALFEYKMVCGKESFSSSKKALCLTLTGKM